MPEQKKKYRLFISAAEPSADAHCAGLITSLKKSESDIEFFGVGGPKMAQAGCELIENTVGKAAMIYNALTNIAYFYRLVKKIKRFFISNKIDLVIVCDSPAFNFHIAKAAKKTGIKTLFYVAPQLWAWGSWRVGKMKKYCDKLCCILPFEQDWFTSRGIKAVFVGNPLLDNLITPENIRATSDERRETKKIALMPGSREAEINTLWLPMQQIAISLKDKYPLVTFVTVALSKKQEEVLRSRQIPGFECQYTIDSVGETAGLNDFSIVASGSATLEVAAAGCPMVIMYQSSRILWHLLGRWIVKTKHLSLVNILAGRELVPEFMPYFNLIEPIVDIIESLLEDRDKLAQISDSLCKLIEPLAKKNAGDEVAKIVIQMLNIQI